MSDIYYEFGVDVLRDNENSGPTGAEMRMAEEIKRLRYLHKRMEDMGVDNVWKARSEVAFELAELRAEIERLRAKIKWLIEDDERLYFVLYRIANPRPFADCPVEMAQNATRGEHLRREAFDGIRRELEGKP